MIWFYVFGLVGGCTGAFFGRLLANKVIVIKLFAFKMALYIWNII